MLLEINFTLILFALSFVIFIYLLNLALYKPVGKIIEERKNLIEDEYSKAKKLAEEANILLDTYKEKIRSAKHDAQNLIHEAIKTSQKKKEGKITELMSNLIKEKELALKQIEEERTNIMQELQKQLSTLTELITNKVLGMENALVGTR